MLITLAFLIIHFTQDENAKGWGKEEGEEETDGHLHCIAPSLSLS